MYAHTCTYTHTYTCMCSPPRNLRRISRPGAAAAPPLRRKFSRKIGETRTFDLISNRAYTHVGSGAHVTLYLSISIYVSLSLSSSKRALAPRSSFI